MTAATIIQRACAARGVALTWLLGGRRWASLSRLRREVMWLLRRLTSLSLQEIARALKLRNHTSVMAGVRKVWAEVKAAPACRGRVDGDGGSVILVRKKSSARISVEELVARALVCAVGVLLVFLISGAG